MNINLKTFGSLFAVVTCLTIGSGCGRDETVGQKLDRAIDKTEETAENARDKADAWHEKAKNKAHKGIDKL